MFNTIWKKFTLALLVVAFVPISYFGYQDLLAAKSSVADEATRKVFLNTITRAKEIERAFINARVDALYLGSGLVVEFLLNAIKEKPEDAVYWKLQVEKEFFKFLSLKPGYSSAGLIDDYGEEVVITVRHGKRVFSLSEIQKHNRLTAPYYVAAAQLDKFEVAAIPMRTLVDRSRDIRNTTLIRYVTTFFDKEGSPMGVIYIDLNGSEIFEGLSLASLERKRPAALVTHDGNYIFNPFAQPEKEMPPRRQTGNIKEEFSGKVVEQILSGRSGIITDPNNHLIAYSAVYPVAGDKKMFYVVFDRYPRALLAPKLSGVKQRYIFGAAGALILILLVSIGVSYALTRQITKLREGAKKFSNREFGHRIKISTHDEIAALAKAYNLMAESLQEYSKSLEMKVEERTARIKQVEKKLAQSEKLAAIGSLSAGVAHEINNPISIIVTRTELMQKEFERGETKNLKKDLETLRIHAARIGKIASNLLTFSREKPGDLSPVDLNEVVKKVAALIEHPVSSKGIALSLDLEKTLPEVWANASGMEQVIYNMAYNAYQATEPGQKINISSRVINDQRVALEITDFGSGIPKTVMEHIFDPFFTTKEVGEGSGLGLSISYGLIQDFGGQVEVKSAPGEGTTFTIYLDTAELRMKKEKEGLIKSDA